jgi:hypothetical protein
LGKGGEEVGLCGPKTPLKLGKEVGAVLSGDNSVRPPISRIRAALNQVRCLEVIEEIGHDCAVDAEVLSQRELTPDGALGSGREHLVAPWTARKVGNCIERSGDVGPKHSAQAPTEIVCQCVVTSAWIVGSVSLTRKIDHIFIIRLGEREALSPRCSVEVMICLEYY